MNGHRRDGWRKAGFNADSGETRQNIEVWEEERAHAERLFGGSSRNVAPVAAEPFAKTPLPDSPLPEHRLTAGEPPRLQDELASLVRRVFVVSATPPRAVMFCGIDAAQPCKTVARIVAELLAECVVGTVALVDTTAADELQEPGPVVSPDGEGRPLNNLRLVVPSHPA